MNKFDRANQKLNSSQSKVFDQQISINGKPYMAAVDRYTPTFDGVAAEVIEVEILCSVAPANLANGHIVDIGDKPRPIRSIGGDGHHLLLILEI